MSVNKDIGEIKIDIAKIQKDISYIIKMVETHDKMLIGNGKIGIKNQVKLLWYSYVAIVIWIVGGFFK